MTVDRARANVDGLGFQGVAGVNSHYVRKVAGLFWGEW